MIIVLLVSIIAMCLVYLTLVSSVACEGKIGLIFLMALIPIAFLLIPLAESYNTYVSTRAFYEAVSEQYFDSIELYSEKAVLNINESTFTDFKYQGYQDNMANLITTLRERVVEYNKIIITKKIMKKNIIFSWLIIAPGENIKVIAIK